MSAAPRRGMRLPVPSEAAFFNFKRPCAAGTSMSPGAKLIDGAKTGSSSRTWTGTRRRPSRPRLLSADRPGLKCSPRSAAVSWSRSGSVWRSSAEVGSPGTRSCSTPSSTAWRRSARNPRFSLEMQKQTASRPRSGCIEYLVTSKPR